MIVLVVLLRIGGLFAWVTSALAIVQALNGWPWLTAWAWVGIAVVLTVLKKAAIRAALGSEQRKIDDVLDRALTTSPLLAAAMEYVQSAEYRSGPSSFDFRYRPTDASGSIVMLLSWACAVGGTLGVVIGAFLTVGGNWTVLVYSVVALLLASPLHAWQKQKYAEIVLPSYEDGLLDRAAGRPSSKLRLALWAAAQSYARPSSDIDERVDNAIDAYRLFVRAWSGKRFGSRLSGA